MVAGYREFFCRISSPIGELQRLLKGLWSSGECTMYYAACELITFVPQPNFLSLPPAVCGLCFRTAVRICFRCTEVEYRLVHVEAGVLLATLNVGPDHLKKRLAWCDKFHDRFHVTIIEPTRIEATGPSSLVAISACSAGRGQRRGRDKPRGKGAYDIVIVAL